MAPSMVATIDGATCNVQFITSDPSPLTYRFQRCVLGPQLELWLPQRNLLRKRVVIMITDHDPARRKGQAYDRLDDIAAGSDESDAAGI